MATGSPSATSSTWRAAARGRNWPRLPGRLLELLNHGLLPVVPGKGSVGASGDLAQLAHLAQPLIGEGRLRGPGDPPQGRPAGELLAEHGIAPLELAPKEGLSLV